MANNIASLERSLQNFSLHDEGSTTTTTTTLGLGGATTDSPPENHPTEEEEEEEEDKPIELNSHVSLPYEWEQCLDLKTGEIYYINWMNGMKVKEDPRLFGVSEYYNNNNYREEEVDDEEDSLVLYDSDESSSESSSASSPLPPDQNVVYNNEDNVLVVAGCKSCLMYFMLPKQVEECPKCNGLLLHFDRSENDSP